MLSINPLRLATWWTTVAIVLSRSFACGGEVRSVGTPLTARAVCDATFAAPSQPVDFGDANGPKASPGAGDSWISDDPKNSAVVLPPLFTLATRPLSTDWYVRFDYFDWSEYDHGANVVNESGTLYTFGYVRTDRAQRFRVELFDGMMHYNGTFFGGDLIRSTSKYLGFRTEYELLWDLNPAGWPTLNFFTGIGTRFWIRDIQDGYIVSTGDYSVGFQETWWIFYPYVGMEKKWIARSGDEFFITGRLGCTAFTQKDTSAEGIDSSHPIGDLTGQIEFGLRHEHLLLSVYFEGMAWAESASLDGLLQPRSQMFTTGLKLGLSF